MLGKLYPIFANVYQVSVFKDSTLSSLKCDCLLYKQCEYPCSHILRITDKVEDTMIKIQHWEIYATLYGVEILLLGKKLMEAIAMQHCYEGCGMPISNPLLQQC